MINFPRERPVNFNCREFVAVIALIENIFSPTTVRSMLRFAAVRDAVRPSIFADGSGFRGLYRREKFTAGNGKRIKRADKEETMTLFPTISLSSLRDSPDSLFFSRKIMLPSYGRKKDLFPRVDSLNWDWSVPARKVD